MKKLFYVFLISIFAISVYSYSPTVSIAATKEDEVTILKKQLKEKDQKIKELNEKIKSLEEKVKALSNTNQNKETTEDQLSKTIKNVTVTIDKVVQDSDSLKIYVTYINNTNDKISNGSDLSKIVANGKQYSYSSDFNFKRWYKKENVPHADTYIEPGVTAQDVIFYAPVDSDSINILIRANWTDYRFNNVKITK
ncbi:hypothetical protein ACIQ1H_14265 [Lysinibacillus sp. NPDC097279]|uniref:hypothetical protein n=1 Tax=Lysinibacillus sp. NPDC097279 TaxID=3364143 RepID=UPI00381094C6